MKLWHENISLTETLHVPEISVSGSVLKMART